MLHTYSFPLSTRNALGIWVCLNASNRFLLGVLRSQLVCKLLLLIIVNMQLISQLLLLCNFNLMKISIKAEAQELLASKI